MAPAMKEITIEVTDLEYRILAEVAKALDARPRDVARGAVRDRIREWDVPIVKRVAALHAEGLPTWEIAASLGVTNVKVRAAMTKLGLRANPGRGRSGRTGGTTP